LTRTWKQKCKATWTLPSLSCSFLLFALPNVGDKLLFTVGEPHGYVLLVIHWLTLRYTNRFLYLRIRCNLVLWVQCCNWCVLTFISIWLHQWSLCLYF
jgi:hypothetical protein